ncbi:hypothetical protein SAMN05428948_2754 [Massilia sp. CF038]|nr:hypothetical protein SAMN05428948_2754 [Massilia sp. CF038]
MQALKEHMEITHEALHELLKTAADQLETAAELIRDLDLAPDSNIPKVGASLVNIFEIQDDIYAVRPDLQANFLKN